MKTVPEFLDMALAQVGQLPPLEVSLMDAVGSILARDALSIVDVPPADLAGRDGYAVRAEDIVGAAHSKPVVLPVTEDVRAGMDVRTALAPKAAIRLSSGAPIPRGADGVVPIEATDQGRDRVSIHMAIEPGDHIRRKAEDLEAGLVALAAGTRVGARQVALLAAAGLGSVEVHPAPRVVVMSIGDELVEPGVTGRPGTVYDANGFGLMTAARDAGAEVFRVSAVPDDKRGLREALDDQMVRADVMITTGGLSYGGGDTVKEVLAPLGTVRFDNVAMTPGRQLGVGSLGNADDDDRGAIPIFCLPGNPTAALIAFEVFVRPALRKMAGFSHIHRRTIRAQAVRGWESPYELEQYVPVRVAGTPSEGYRFEPTASPDAPLMYGMSRANALARVPAGTGAVAVGEWFPCIVLEG